MKTKRKMGMRKEMRKWIVEGVKERRKEVI